MRKIILSLILITSAYTLYAGSTFNSEGFFLNNVGTKDLGVSVPAPAPAPKVTAPAKVRVPEGTDMDYSFDPRDRRTKDPISSVVDKKEAASKKDKKEEGQAFELWYPMCLFMEQEAIDFKEGNKTVKGLVDDAAACGVNLVVFPFAITSTMEDPEWINAQAQKVCNINKGLGVERASVSTCVRHERSADKMCGKDDPSKPSTVAGCAQMQSSGREQLNDKQKARVKEHLGAKASFGGGGIPAPSIEDKGGCTAATVGHEALGHSMWGHPNGEGDGNGIGLQEGKEGGATGGAGNSSIGGGVGGRAGGTWSDLGCAAMRANAFVNDGTWKWEKNKNDYFVESKDPNSVIDLGISQPIWKQ